MIIYAKPDKAFIKASANILKAVPKMQARAQRDALKKAKTAFMDTKGGDPSIYKVKKKKDLAPNTKLTDDSMIVESRMLTIGTTTHFSITPRSYKSTRGIQVRRRTRATDTIRRGAKEPMPKSFIINPAKINGGNTMIWEHFGGKGSKKIRPVKSTSAAQMASNEKVYPYIEEKMMETYGKRLEHYYEREVAKNAHH